MTSQSTETATANTGDRRRINALAALNLPRYVLLPGDPERVDFMASQWETSEVIALPRGYRAAVGTYKGVRIGAVSTMMGAPSLDIVLADLVKLGIDTFIRVGTCGTLKEDIEPGSLIINDASVRLDGTSHFYVRNEFPAVASHEVTFALVDAAATNGFSHCVGTGATTGSFIAGQGRPGFNGYVAPEGERILEEMKRAGVLNFEMETAALLTLARIYGLRAGAICSVIANRITGVWDESGGVARACLIGAEAIRRLAEWDQRAGEAGRTLITATDV
ncbi:MAG: nucleoside phosphorylase [Aquamicrobium sp.]|uniref:nucleoside phosphorylase n=1 Tax=Mesorhizobium sp. Pch-S TaxID=2082387 RepID=UPI00101056FB|nr:nucleoside phosphorylase [Mesorhizobium sp. Pch-S]MBR2690358.1 nucleoside phosphorylase [Aquamicrobium sp.]QAZ42538.1 uridine phosphorylase [Mesorhizobium sp. Pch-S]